MSSISKFDTIYRNILLSKFFTQGWGNHDNMKRIFEFRKIMSNRETCKNLVSSNYRIYIDSRVEDNHSYTIYEGHLLSPLVHYLPESVPKESQIARFQLILPKVWSHCKLKPICIHFAGTGDHYFWKRRIGLAKPLLKEYGFGSIILENPFCTQFYFLILHREQKKDGSRKPADQKRSSLKNVSDIFIMGGCLVLESLALLHWCERMNFGPFCVTGVSMGGHMASLAGTNWHKPIAIVPCLSWTTASCVFTQGVMSGSIPWNLLETQYMSSGEKFKELQRMIHSPENNNAAFNAGRHFAKTFPNVFDSLFYSDFLPLLSAKFSNKNSNNSENNYQAMNDTFSFMRGIMDECTHLGNFSVPVDPELAIIVNASRDGYVPRIDVQALTDIWPNSTVRYIDCGHITAILFNLSVFRKAIADAMEITAQKYYNTTLFDNSKTQSLSIRADNC